VTDNGRATVFLIHSPELQRLEWRLVREQKDATLTNHYRLGIGAGNERGLLNEIQTDYGYAGLRGIRRNGREQFYQIDIC